MSIKGRYAKNMMGLKRPKYHHHHHHHHHHQKTSKVKFHRFHNLNIECPAPVAGSSAGLIIIIMVIIDDNDDDDDDDDNDADDALPSWALLG